MISVIVPIYKVGKFLPECIDSILAQTYKDFELILVNDGSPDISKVLIQEYASRDDRIIVVDKPNGGLSSARNAGTEISKGEYITYVDSDDVLHPKYLELLYSGLQFTGAQTSVVKYNLFYDGDPLPFENYNPDTEPIYPPKMITGREACKMIVHEHQRYMIMATTKLYSRELIEDLHYPEGKLNEDEFTTYKPLFDSDLVALYEAPYYGYRQRKGSIMTNLSGTRKYDALEGIHSAVDFLMERGDPELAAYARKRYLLSLELAWTKEKMRFEVDEEFVLLKRLEKTHDRYYEENKDTIKPCLTQVEKIMVILFLISPSLYMVIAMIYSRIFGNE